MPGTVLTFRLLAVAAVVVFFSASAFALDTAERQRLSNRIEGYVQQLEQQEAALVQKEKKQRQNLLQKLQGSRRTVVEMVRLRHFPEQALFVHDVLQGNYQRNRLIAVSRAHMENSLNMLSSDILALAREKDDVQQKIAYLKNIKSHLQNNPEKIQNLLSDLQKANTMAEVLAHMGASTHVLPEKYMPTSGQISRVFGELDTSGLNAHGVTIQGMPGGAVVVPKAGTVSYSGPFSGYGVVVIVQHEGGNHTVYGGMGEARRAVGTQLNVGETVGYLPLNDAPELYFEVRKNGEAIDPVSWLD